MKPHRTQTIAVSGGNWTHAQANPTTQVFYIPLWQVRNCTDRQFKKHADALLIGCSETTRQRMATNGYQAEVCPTNVCDGTFWQSLRQGHGIWTFAGATTVGSNSSAVAGGQEEPNPKNYVGSCFIWHEMLWAELGIFFPAGQRPSGKDAYTLIHQWPEIIALAADCVTDGAPSAYNSDPASFCNVMRCGQRLETHPNFTAAIPFNATAAQVKTAVENCQYIRAGVLGDDISVTGGSLPAAVDVSFSPGQYNNKNVVPFTVKTNSLAGGSSPTPVITMVTTGSTGHGAPYNITATSAVQRITTTGSPTSGTFVLNFGGGIDRRLEIVGPGSVTGTPQSRVDRWDTICTNNGWTP